MIYTQPQRPEPQFDLAQFQAILEQMRLQQQQPNPLATVLTGIVKVAAVGVVIGLGVAVVDSLLGEDGPIPRYCSLCGREGHDARICTRRGERRPIPAWLDKTGWCECCERRFKNTYWHHYAGRGVDKWMEMCLRCHVNCGHNGHTQNDAVRPMYCRNMAA